MQILLLSAYDADSHRRWHQGLRAQFPEYQWTLLTLPPRYFSWRIRGNSLSWSFEQREVLERPYDLVIATSMTDLSALRGMVPKLAMIPTIVYFHENQFAYPDNQLQSRPRTSKTRQQLNVEPQMLNLYTALCGDAIVFNTDYNRQTFLNGVAELLKKLPDHVPKGVVEQLSVRSTVLPVPLEDACFTPIACRPEVEQELWPVRSTAEHQRKHPEQRPLRLLWAARWEFDKGPVLLLAILEELQRQQVSFQLCLLGQKFRQSPPQFQTIQTAFAAHLVQFGHEPDVHRYRQWLATADMVLSTALHEFQGLAVLEAIAAGCTPVLPNRLSYPEIVSHRYLYDVSSSDVDGQAQQAVACMLDLRTAQEEGMPVPKVERWSWAEQQVRYRQLMTGLV